MKERFSYLAYLQLLLNVDSTVNIVLQVSKQDKNMSVLRRATLSWGKKQFLKPLCQGRLEPGQRGREDQGVILNTC